MKGKILDYSIQESSGLISGNDNNRYSFSTSEWRSAKSPEINQVVDFEIEGKEAKDIFLDETTIQTNDSIWMAITSLILGIIAFLSIFDPAAKYDSDIQAGMFLFASASLTLGILTLKKKLNGKNMALAGIILSSLVFIGLFNITA